ncbi:MAG TPA: DUF4097 family beta strand repeat-containing protein [Pseudolysinimonas sp.]|nr:DUF4097 family beta strand repeat-containing protein [Pseudolysinimonas sp.]
MPEQKWLVDSPKTIDIDAARALKVELISGQIDIVAHDEPHMRIEVHSVQGKSIKISVTGDSVEIDQPQLGWENWFDVVRSFRGAKADVTVLVPRTTSIKLGVVNAATLVSGVHANITLSTVNGEIVVDNAVGKLQLNTVNGELTVRDHTGPVTAHSVSGDLTASGALESLGSDSVSGSVFVDASGTPDKLRVNTVSGAVRARLDAGVGAAYTLSTVGGKLHIDGDSLRGVRGQYTGRYGELDGHWADVRINTVGGDISILHAEPSARAAGTTPKNAA